MVVYKFEVALYHDMATYRHIEILGNQTLDVLHKIIFDAFDRYDEHLYSFYLTRKVTKSLQKRYNSTEYTASEGLSDDFLFLDRKKKYSASKTKIDHLDLCEKDKLYYLFDFGDCWWHEITLLSMMETDQKKGYPKIVKKAGESPDQYPDYEEDY